MPQLCVLGGILGKLSPRAPQPPLARLEVCRYWSCWRRMAAATAVVVVVVAVAVADAGGGGGGGGGAAAAAEHRDLCGGDVGLDLVPGAQLGGV